MRTRGALGVGYAPSVGSQGRAVASRSAVGALAWLILALSWPASALPAGSADVRIGPVPAWVEPAEVPTGKLPEQKSGQALLLLDVQVRAVGSERVRFVRGAVRVTSQVGVQDAAQRTIEFDPPHQRLVVHRLDVRRGAEVVSHLKSRNLQVLQREARLEDSVYDGTRTAVAVFPDVRVGDVIVYEYSLVGDNPVLAGHVADSWQLAGPIEIGRLRYRMITDRALSVRAFAGAAQPERVVRAGLNEYRHTSEDLPAIVLEERMPGDYRAIPWVQLTDFGSWREVADWGAKLFAVPARPGPRVLALAREIREASSDSDQQILALLRRIQDDIRYFSLAFAESSHRPASPELVLERRYGDCKDKALLMVSVARALGIAVHPALVSSGNGALLSELLPSAGPFDHVIVRVGPAGRARYLDPTRMYQRGRMRDVAPRGYYSALVLAEGETDLAHVPELIDERPDMHSLVGVRFELFGGPVTLDVRTTYTGYRAEVVRALAASASRDELNQALEEDVVRAYPKAKRTGDALVSDDEASNAVTVAQSFALEEAWVQEGGVTRLSLRPPSISGRLPAAATDRRHPLALEHPLRIVNDLEVATPAPVAVEDEVKNIATPAFSFDYRVARSGSAVRVHYALATHSRRVDRHELGGYRTAQDGASRYLEYQITHDPRLALARTPLWLMIAAALTALLALGAVGWVERRRPYLAMPSVPWEPALAGRRGWLALLGFAVTIAPARVLYTSVKSLPAYSGPSWVALTTVGSPAYHALYAPLLTVELLVNVTLVIGVGYLAYLYWAKRRSFPLVFVAVQVFSLVFLVTDHLAATAIPGSDSAASFGRQLGALVGTLLWTGYVLWSKRVKATFLPAPGERKRELARARREARKAARARATP